MDGKNNGTSSSTTTDSCKPKVAPAPPPQQQEKINNNRFWNVLPFIIYFFLAVNFALTTYRVRRNPWDLAFVMFAYTILVLLFLCLRKLEQVTLLQSPAEQTTRGRLKFAVWLLSTALSFTFAYRVSLIMPCFLILVIWGMTLFVTVGGFYGLFIYDCHHHYASMENRSEEGVGDQKSFRKVSPQEKV